VAIGFIAFLALLLVSQALLFVWAATRTPGAFPVQSNARLGEIVASDIRTRLEEDPRLDVGAHIESEYRRIVQPVIVVMRDGRTFANHTDVSPFLIRNARGAFERFVEGRPPRRGRGGGGRGRGEPPPPGAPAAVPILLEGEVAGMVFIPPGQPGPFGSLRVLAPMLAASGVALLIIGAGLAALVIFGPVRRRLGQLETAADRIGSGDVAARAPERGGDEVAALAKSFNRMAADLETRAAAVAASDQARRQLLADVSHELMTPLTAIRGYIETLRMAEMRLDTPTRARYLGIVDEETRRLEHIIGDLLDLARLEGGGSSMRREPVALPALFARVAERHHRELEARGIRLLQHVDPEARLVRGDADRLEQALQNLAANALRHTPDGGEITLASERTPQAVRLVVRDTGPGIAPEHLPLIFDRFYKADAARATGGSGLGLSIVKAIVERHGGTIAARNDNGAVFEITLPESDGGQTGVRPR
jgi:signal transduction histidine kinase